MEPTISGIRHPLGLTNGVGHGTRSQWKQRASHCCKSSLPITIIYRKANGAWLQHLLMFLLIPESALLRHAVAKPGLVVYAPRPFRGTKSLQGSKERRWLVIGGASRASLCSHHKPGSRRPRGVSRHGYHRRSSRKLSQLT